MEIKIMVNTADKDLANEIIEFLEDLKVKQNFETRYEIKDGQNLVPVKSAQYFDTTPFYPTHLYHPTPTVPWPYYNLYPTGVGNKATADGVYSTSGNVKTYRDDFIHPSPIFGSLTPMPRAEID